MRQHRGLAALVVLVAAGCVSTNAIRLGTAGSFPEVPAEEVAVYRTADQVPGEYEEVALLNSSGPTGWTSEAGMIESMRREAGKLGANAIILDALSEPSAGAKVAASVFGTSAERTGKAVAIRVLDGGGIWLQ